MAIEAVATSLFAGSSTLGDALKSAKRRETLNPMIVMTLDKLYAVRNATVGHGREGGHRFTRPEAEFIVTTCAAGLTLFLSTFDLTE